MQKTKRVNPRSSAMRWMEWYSIRDNFKRGEKPGPRTQGRCVFAMRRAYPRYIYECKRKRMTLGTFQQWQQSGSKGGFFNSFIRGVY